MSHKWLATSDKWGILPILSSYPSFNNIRRAVARSENPGGLIVLGGDNVPPLVEIGLTDL